METVLAQAREGKELRVVDDQTATPTYTRDLARKLVQLLTTEYYGTFHITNRGACTRYQFAGEILKQAGLEAALLPVTSEQYPLPARRPAYSVLDNFHLRLLGMDDMRPWPEALKDYLAARKPAPERGK